MTITESEPAVIDLVDPRTGTVRGHCPDSGEREVAAAVAAGREASEPWSGLTPRERSRRLLRLADLIEDKIEQYVALECAGTGKPVTEATAEIAESADLFRFYAGAVRADMTPASGHVIAGYESWVRWEPLGVIGAIVPWNYPLLMAAWRCAPSLAAGNTVVLKPAETTPDTAQLLERDAAEALGPNVLRSVTGGRRTGQLLVESNIDAVAFTGSVRGGQDVARRAGLRHVSLELGGNCPVLILPDAPAYTWAELARAVTYNAGQSCAAPARVITTRDAYEGVVDGVAEAMANRSAGLDFGPLNNPDQVTRYDSLVGGAAAGFRRTGLAAGEAAQQGGFWRPSCVLAEIPQDDPAVLEEVFAPVLTIQVAETAEAAVRLANGVPQSLAASVWSKDLDAALSLAGHLDAGEVWVNCHLVQSAELPHGGRRHSGSGTDLSVLALAEYQRPKTVTVRVNRFGTPLGEG